MGETGVRRRAVTGSALSAPLQASHRAATPSDGAGGDRGHAQEKERAEGRMALTAPGRRFLIGLFAGLAAVAWVGSEAVTRTTRNWFGRDVTLRAHLA